MCYRTIPVITGSLVWLMRYEPSEFNDLMNQFRKRRSGRRAKRQVYENTEQTVAWCPPAESCTPERTFPAPIEPQQFPQVTQSTQQQGFTQSGYITRSPSDSFQPVAWTSAPVDHWSAGPVDHGWGTPPVDAMWGHEPVQAPCDPVMNANQTAADRLAQLEAENDILQKLADEHRAKLQALEQQMFVFFEQIAIAEEAFGCGARAMWNSAQIEEDD